jgi:hypothetical protein
MRKRTRVLRQEVWSDWLSRSPLLKEYVDLLPHHRRIIVPERGWKTRPVTAAEDRLVVVGHWVQEQLMSTLRRIPWVAASLRGDHAKVVSEWGDIMPWNVLDSADLTTATDLIHQDAFAGALDEVALRLRWSEDFSLVAHLLVGPQRISDDFTGEEFVTDRGALMGLPSTWGLLCLLNVGAAAAASLRVEGTFPKKLAICGDDLAAEWRKATAAEYRRIGRGIGMVFSKNTDFQSKSLLCFTEEFWRAEPRGPTIVAPVALYRGHETTVVRKVRAALRWSGAGMFNIHRPESVVSGPMTYAQTVASRAAGGNVSIPPQDLVQLKRRLDRLIKTTAWRHGVGLYSLRKENSLSLKVQDLGQVGINLLNSYNRAHSRKVRALRLVHLEQVFPIRGLCAVAGMRGEERGRPPWWVTIGTASTCAALTHPAASRAISHVVRTAWPGLAKSFRHWGILPYWPRPLGGAGLVPSQGLGARCGALASTRVRAAGAIQMYGSSVEDAISLDACWNQARPAASWELAEELATMDLEGWSRTSSRGPVPPSESAVPLGDLLTHLSAQYARTMILEGSLEPSQVRGFGARPERVGRALRTRLGTLAGKGWINPLSGRRSLGDLWARIQNDLLAEWVTPTGERRGGAKSKGLWIAPQTLRNRSLWTAAGLSSLLHGSEEWPPTQPR